MNNNQGFIAKDYICRIEPYVAGKPIEETAKEYGLNIKDIVKLASNENPWGMPESARQAVIDAAGSIERYPDGNARVFRSAVASHFGVQDDWVIAGNGSDEILGLIARLVLKPGTSCVFSQYSFSVYMLSAQENGAECREVPARDFAVDLDAMVRAIDETTRLVFITNPNNPTGLTLRAAQIEAFIRQVPSDCLILLDEAYIDFMQPEDRPDTLRFVREHTNVVMTRTFSKAYGLAGLRAGFAIAQPALIEMLNRIRPPFNMNRLAQAAAAGCIDDQDFLNAVYQKNRQGIGQLTACFEKHQLRYLPTQANFILVHIGERAAEVNRALLKRGIIVRPVTSYGLPHWLRISVGTSDQNDRLIAALDEIL